MKMHNWKDVTKYFMDIGEEAETELWDYITGLRGPDNNSDSWKEIITCIIRGECTTAHGIDITRSFLSLWNNDAIIKFLNQNIESITSHWFNHCIYALGSLSQYYRDEMNNIKMSDLLSRLIHNLENRSIEDRIDILITVREIVKEFYKEE